MSSMGSSDMNVPQGMAGMSTAESPTGAAAVPQGEGDTGGAMSIPQPGSPAHPGSSTHSGGVIHYLANLLGDTHEERVENAKALASSLEKIGDTVQDLSGKTLLMRMYRAQMKPMAVIEGPKMGIENARMLPSSLDPQLAEAIMSRMGYGR